jgi:hypothetical protein
MFAHDAPISPLYAIVDAAKCFGLTDDEVLQAIDECFCPDDLASTVADCIDELVIALARRILQAAADPHRRRSQLD